MFDIFTNKHARYLKYAQQYESIRAKILLMGVLEETENGSLVTLSSRVRGEGVTTVALGLAAEFASSSNAGEVLLLDAAPVGTKVAKLIKAKNQPFRLADQSGMEHVSESITYVKKLNIDLLTLQVLPGSTGESQELLLELLLELRLRYKVILVDTGALDSPVPHTWLRYADYSVLVLDSANTTVDAIERFGSSAKNSKFKFNGFVMNKRPFHIPTFLYK